MAHDVSCSERGTASQPGRQTDQDATLLQERALPPCFRPSLKDQTLGLRCGVGVGGLLKLDHPATATLGRLVVCTFRQSCARLVVDLIYIS
jgi:hypothetical protein